MAQLSGIRKLFILLAGCSLVLVLAAGFLSMLGEAQAREVAAACKGLRPNPTNPVYQAIPSSTGEFPTALDFAVQNHRGERVNLSDYRGKVVLVNFWASWCNVCKSEKPGLEELQRKYDPNDVVVLALASDTDWDKVRAALPDGSPLTVLLDPPADDGNLGAVAKEYGITAVPETFVVDRDGLLRYYMINRRDWNSGIAETCIDALVQEG